MAMARESSSCTAPGTKWSSFPPSHISKITHPRLARTSSFTSPQQNTAVVASELYKAGKASYILIPGPKRRCAMFAVSEFGGLLKAKPVA